MNDIQNKALNKIAELVEEGADKVTPLAKETVRQYSAREGMLAKFSYAMTCLCLCGTGISTFMVLKGCAMVALSKNVEHAADKYGSCEIAVLPIVIIIAFSVTGIVAFIGCTCWLETAFRHHACAKNPYPGLIDK